MPKGVRQTRYVKNKNWRSIIPAGYKSKSEASKAGAPRIDLIFFPIPGYALVFHNFPHSIMYAHQDANPGGYRTHNLENAKRSARRWLRRALATSE